MSGGGGTPGPTPPPPPPTWQPTEVTDDQLPKIAGLAVDVYHLNIGTGDAAIYYLVQYPPPDLTRANPDILPYIHRACLIDGGKAAGASQIRNFLELVPQSYQFSKSQGGRTNLLFPPFDAIVITHWDNDHYGGVLELISAHVKSVWATNYPSPAWNEKTQTFAADTHAVARATWVTQYLSPYMKYNLTVPNAPRADSAQTYMYIPYWGPHGRFKFPDGATAAGYQKYESGQRWGRFFPYYGTAAVPTSVPQTWEDDSWLDWNAEPILYEQRRKEDWWAKKICKLRAGNSSFLGANLFTNWKLPYREARLIRNPAQMALAHQTRTATAAAANALPVHSDDQAAVPFLILVGANSECCGDQGRVGTLNDEFRLIQTGINALGAGYFDPEPQVELESEIKSTYDALFTSSSSGPPPIGSFSPNRQATTTLSGSRASEKSTEAGKTPSTGGSLVPTASDLRVISSSSDPAKTPLVTTVHNSTAVNTSEKILSGSFTTDHTTIPSKSIIPFGNPPTGSLVITPSTLPPSFAAKLNAIHRGGLVRVINIALADTVPKQANAVSIETMVAWTNGQISHFAGGDANWQNEMKFVAWIHFGNNPFRCVRTVKIQHHGSADSTPAEMVRYLRPRTMVISCNTTQFHHPRFELVLWIYLWFHATKIGRVNINFQRSNDSTKPPIQVSTGSGILQSTAYPYYLSIDPRTKGYVKIKEGLDTTSFDASPGVDTPIAKYQTSMNHLAGMLRITDLFTQVSTARTGGTHVETALSHLVAATWPLISYQVTKERPAKSGIIDTDTHIIYDSNERIEWIRVSCRPFSSNLRARLDGVIDGYSYSKKGIQLEVKKQKPPRRYGPKETSKLDREEDMRLRVDEFKKAFTARQKESRWELIVRKRKEVLEELGRMRAAAAWNTTEKPMPDRDHGTYDFDSLYMFDDPKPMSDEDKSTVRTTEIRPATSGNSITGESGISSSHGSKLAVRPVMTEVGSSSTPPSGPYDVITSDIAATWSQVTGRTNPVYILDDGDDFSALLSFMDFSALMIDGPGNNLIMADVLRDWLVTGAGGSADDTRNVVSIVPQGPQTATKIQKMSLELVPLIPGSQTTRSLTFDSSLAASNFATDIDTTKFSLPDSGVFVTKLMLCMGLSISAGADNPAWTLTDILSYLSVDVGNTATFVDSLVESGSGDFLLQRGMIWYLPTRDNLIVQRMEWELTPTIVSRWLGWLPTAGTPAKCSLIGRITNRQAPASAGYIVQRETEILAKLDIDLPVGPNGVIITAAMDFNLSSDADTITFSLNFSPPNAGGTVESTRTASFTDILAWIFSKVLSGLGIDPSPIVDCLPNLKIASVRRLEMFCACSSMDSISIQRIKVDVEVIPGWTDAAGNQVPLLFTYTWRANVEQPHSMEAQVWFQPALDIYAPPQITPTYEPGRVFYPSGPATSRILLLSMMNDNYKLPFELDLSITGLALSIQDRTVSFTGKLQASSQSNPQSTPHLGIVLVEVELDASYTWSDSHVPDTNSFSITLNVMIQLPPAPGYSDPLNSDDGESSIDASIQLLKVDGQKMFKLIGGVEYLNLAQIAQFFPGEDSGIVMDILGHINIHTFNIEYDYSPTDGSASSFSINATLILGPVELVLSFTRDQIQWSFTAMVEMSEGIQNAQVGTILNSLLGDNQSAKDLVAAMPGFITNIDLANGKAMLTLRVNSVANTKGDNPKAGSVTVGLALDLPGPEGLEFEVAFVQIAEKLLTAPPAGTNAKDRTKRLIKVTMGDLPWGKIPKPPLVDSVSPAFDQLAFYWVQDPIASVGLSQGEVAKMQGVTPVQYMAKSSQTSTVDTIVLTCGWHFMVLDSGGHGTPKALLDYAFNKPKPSTTPSNNNGANTSPSPPPVPTTIPGIPENGQDGDGTSKAALEKTAGPLKITNVGVRFEAGELILFCDIIAHLGPIEFSLLGFGMGLNMTGITLKDLATLIPSLHLSGMAIEFNQPPVTIAGMFVDRSDANMKMYIGGVALTVQPYSFMAVGAYGEVKKPGLADNMTLAQASDKGYTFKTVFIFAKLNGPLIELEFATLGGISLGFGYNSNIRFPSIEEVPSFPFISNSAGGAGADPLDVMQKLSSKDPKTGVVTPADGSYWLAAGLEGKAFEILDVSAVVVIEFNPYVNLGIFARASAQMPPEPTPRLACFTYVELGIAASCDFHNGALIIEAQLSPNSFVMNPLCHLTGGFALCTWFNPSPHVGDFAFTLGGFHPAYNLPDHYPNPPRLAITWGISDNLFIKGEAYFAVTPKAVMGGGSLNAVFNLGVLYAYFLAHADFLMTFHPFHFVADIGVEIGVEFDLELLFITIHISVHLSAGVHLAGPSFGGYAYVDFWVFGFTVPFGDQNDKPPALKLNQFRDLLLQVPDPDSPVAPSGTSISNLHVLSVELGRFTEKQKDTETKKGEVWEVKRGGFVFRVQSRIPLQSITEPVFMIDPNAVTTSSSPFYGTPMHLKSQLTSYMTVTVQKIEDEPGVLPIDVDFRCSAQVLKPMPLTIWGPYDENGPGTGNNNITSALDSSPGTTTLMMGASFTAPPPRHSFDKLVTFNAVAAASQDVFSDGGHPVLSPAVMYSDAEWTAEDPVDSSKQADAQWANVLKKWQNPEIIMTTPATTAADGTPKPPASIIPNQDVVQAAIDVWSAAFGWSSNNALKNDVTYAGGVQPIVWDQFDNLYMASPVICVVGN